MVELIYKAYTNDKTVFDESGDEPFKIILGDERLIEPAIEEIQYMKKGEKSIFSCRAEYAFGEDRLPDGVAPN
eukprot:CAMPEP_0168315544 /NCGR_PEP_ID=MMETSP0210-20121227/11625_1 /TAXON_ID=40633 /ORGANISM="Condylostoma magnum, Strain COL2" /LENGTH=72 /DNA_ID=CAMNT_0008289363 /DNA_START=69 /DNA_END=287 /DNA_ORIENTATION=+